MKKIKLSHIVTEVASKNFANLLNDNKTYFLNGAWGSGKTDFLKETEGVSKKKFIYLDLWNIKDSKTVLNIVFDRLHRILAKLKYLLIISVPIAVLSQNQVNLGLSEYLPDYLKIISTVVTLVLLSFQFIKPKSDNLYLFFLKYLTCFKNKVIIIDDFDRVSSEKQEEAYKLFNLLHKKVTFIFCGNIDYVVKNEGNYLQKIIDRQIELPYVSHPKNIWNDYFKILEENLGIEDCSQLVDIFVLEKRNLRDRTHFNDFVTLEFFEHGKLGHVQALQQLTIIYIYLFHKEKYNQMLDSRSVLLDAGMWCLSKELSDYLISLENKKYGRDSIFYDETVPKDVLPLETIEKKLFDLLKRQSNYPPDYQDNRVGYFIYESISNLSHEDAEKIFANDSVLKNALKPDFEHYEDFSKFIASKYNESKTEISLQRISMLDERNYVDSFAENCKRLEKIAFELLAENFEGSIIEYIINEKWRPVYQRIKANDFSSEKLRLQLESEKVDEEYISHIIKFELYNDFWEPIFNQYNFDLSQKIHFYWYFIKVGTLPMKKHYKDEFIKTDFAKQKRKACFLFAKLSHIEKTTPIAKLQWSEDDKKLIDTLSDDDYISFWKLEQVISDEGGELQIFRNVDAFDFYSNNHYSINYSEIIDYIKPRLDDIVSRGRYSYIIRDKK